jgi:hypothetical protein
MAKEPITTRLDADTKQEVENYAEDHGIGQTEAARRLIRSGLADEGYPVAAADGGGTNTETFLERLASERVMNLGALLIAVALGTFIVAPSPPLAIGLLAVCVGALGALTVWASTAAWYMLGRSVRDRLPFAEEGETA